MSTAEKSLSIKERSVAAVGGAIAFIITCHTLQINTWLENRV